METAKKEQVTQNAVKLVGEAILPGASLLIDGKILEGGAHVIAGVAARALLGPIGWALVVANSFSRSTTGKGLLKQFTKEDAAKAASAPPPVAPVTTAPVVVPSTTISKP